MRKMLLLAAIALFALTACGSEEPDDADTAGQPLFSEAPTEQGGPCGAEGELGIEDTKEGNGKEARRGEVLKVDYTGKLEDGSQFDSSLDPGRSPFVFRLGAGEVIAGWDEGFVGMKEGGKRTLTIPWNMGYGETGAPPAIPPCSTLIFEVELIKVLGK